MPNENLLARLREVAQNIALTPTMPTRDGETCDLAHDEIARLHRELREAREAIRKMYLWADKFKEASEILALPAVRVAVEVAPFVARS